MIMLLFFSSQNKIIYNANKLWKLLKWQVTVRHKRSEDMRLYLNMLLYDF